MKKITLLAFALVAFSITSCKKERVCECTTTYTASNGNITTNPNDNVTYKDIKKSDAKSLCQKSTDISVDANGATNTTVHDCKLK